MEDGADPGSTVASAGCVCSSSYMRRPALLYLSYDGMLEPLGQSQVLGYLERLTDDYDVHLISFEKKGDWTAGNSRAEVTRRIENAKIHWIPLRYHKRPTAAATAYDIAAGILVALWQAVRHRTSIVHARSYVAALIALVVTRITCAKFLFDMRGLWADERVDAGLWPAGGFLFRIAKRLERRYLLAADAVVTLTHASEREIRSFPYLAGRMVRLFVIPTCANLDAFRLGARRQHQPFTFGFVGAAGTWSMIDEVFAVFKMLRMREPTARLLIVNRNEHEYIRSELKAAGIDPSHVEIVAAEHDEVPSLVARMTVAAAVRRPVYSQVACAPTKFAEYLGCGVPCLVNAGVGDLADIVEEDGVGVVLRDFSDPARLEAADQLLALGRERGIRERCARSARKRFSLEDGVAAYRRIYRDLMGQGAA